MKTIALIPPKPVLNIPRQKTAVEICTSGGKPLNASGECACCSD